MTRLQPVAAPFASTSYVTRSPPTHATSWARKEDKSDATPRDMAQSWDDKDE